jgi:hypothetical protein
MQSRVEGRNSLKNLFPLAFAAVLFGSPGPAQADCMTDIEGRVICDRGQCMRNIHGEVYCSRYKDGAAMLDGHGGIVCGKGDCVVTIEGDIICSARPGGAAMMDLYGKVTCEGGCERASVSLCGSRSGAPR